MIRQAISCDVCGAEKRQTNHWFVACEHAGELRISGLTGGRMRTGTRHLCGQTCLHKLLDDFIAGKLSSRPQPATDLLEHDQPAATDTSLTANGACAAPALPATARSLQVLPAAVIAIAPSRALDASSAGGPTSDESLSCMSRRRRAEAWERERERCALLTAHHKIS